MTIQEILSFFCFLTLSKLEQQVGLLTMVPPGWQIKGFGPFPVSRHFTNVNSKLECWQWYRQGDNSRDFVVFLFLDTFQKWTVSWIVDVDTARVTIQGIWSFFSFYTLFKSGQQIGLLTLIPPGWQFKGFGRFTVSRHFTNVNSKLDCWQWYRQGDNSRDFVVFLFLDTFDYRKCL